MRHRALLLIAGLLCANLGYAEVPPMPAPAPAPLKKLEDVVAGIKVHRIQEPVFDGLAYVYETGVDNARTVMLVHGLGDEGALDFAEQIPWLAKSFHVILVDLPGFGRSDKANLLYTPGNYAKFLKYVSDKFAHGPIVLIGHSMGGVISLRYAALYPDNVSLLTVIDTPGVLHRYTFSSHVLSRFGTDFLPAAVDPIEKIGRLARRLLIPAERMKVDPDVILMNASLRQSMLGGDPKKIASLAVAVENMSKDLAKIRAETLVVWGKKDTVAPLRTGKVLAAMIPHVQLTVIDRAEHVPMTETPERFNAVLESFLGRGFASTPTPPAEMKKQGEAHCRDKNNVVYEGEYDLITLEDCSGVRIRNARVRALRMEDAKVTIEDSEIGGDDVAVTARSSTVEITGGRIDGKVAISAWGSRFDLAGVRVTASEAVMKATRQSAIVMTICQVNSPRLDGIIHNYYTVTEDKPL